MYKTIAQTASPLKRVAIVVKFEKVQLARLLSITCCDIECPWVVLNCCFDLGVECHLVSDTTIVMWGEQVVAAFMLVFLWFARISCWLYIIYIALSACVLN